MSFDQEREAIAQFRKAIQAAGLQPPEEIVPNGVIHRFASDDKRGKDAWYVLYLDSVPAGAFGSWRKDFKQNWRMELNRPLTAVEKAQHEVKISTARRAAEAERARLQTETAVKALEI